MISVKRSVILSILMIIAFVYLQFMGSGQPVSPLQPLSTFPKTIEKWRGVESFFSKEIYEAVGVDDSALISYYDKKSRNVQLYIGYYSSQKEGDLIHSPKNCMPGSGWEITKTDLEDIKLTPEKSINVIKLTLEKNTQKQIVLYWFHSRGRVINSEYKQKMFLVLDSIFRSRTDGSFVRLIAPVNGEEVDTVKYMKEFAVDLFPLLNEYIPN